MNDMNTHIAIRFASITAVLLCLLSISNTVFAKNKVSTNPAIAELQHKYFRMSTTNGKQSMVLITGYSGEAWNQKWLSEGYGNPCVNNVAGLMRAEAATEIKGASKILAFLDCPAANDGGAESVVSLFESSNTDVPVCFSRINLMDQEGYYYWGAVRSVAVRKLADDDYIVAPVLGGGDAGDSWSSHAFLHMDSKCQLTLLARFYAGMYYDTDNEGLCEGERDSYRFVSDSIIELRRVSVMCTPKGERTRPVMTKRLDLKLLLHKPKQRIFEPQ